MVFGHFFINFVAEMETKNHLCICALRGLKGSIPLVKGDSLYGSLGSSTDDGDNLHQGKGIISMTREDYLNSW